jgi:hypothetical protein
LRQRETQAGGLTEAHAMQLASRALFEHRHSLERLDSPAGTPAKTIQ